MYKSNGTEQLGYTWQLRTPFSDLDARNMVCDGLMFLSLGLSFIAVVLKHVHHSSGVGGESSIQPMRLKHRVRCLALSCVYTLLVGAAELRAIGSEIGRGDLGVENGHDCNLGINLAVAGLKITIGTATLINYVVVHRVFCLAPGTFDVTGQTKIWRDTKGTPRERYKRRRKLLKDLAQISDLPYSIRMFNTATVVMMCLQICLGLVAADYAPSNGQPDYHPNKLNGLCVITTLQINYVLGVLLWGGSGMCLKVWWTLRASHEERQVEKHKETLNQIHHNLTATKKHVRKDIIDACKTDMCCFTGHHAATMPTAVVCKSRRLGI